MITSSPQLNSTKGLKIGDYWAVPLDNGQYGCVVITDLKEEGAGSKTSLVIGVLNWSGSDLPSENDVLNAVILQQGLTDVQAIGGKNTGILGSVTLPDNLPGVSPFRSVDVGVKTYTYGYNNLHNTISRLVN